MAAMAIAGLDGGDPRLQDEKSMYTGQGFVNYTRPQMRKLHDRSVTFEEYYYYAQQTRAMELTYPVEGHTGIVGMLVPSKSSKGVGLDSDRKESLVPAVNISDKSQRSNISDEEWTNASRAVRTASAGACFYLITTDILGPFGLPYAFATTGWGPGAALYTVFGAFAGIGGWLLWQCFMGLDSYEYPCKHYGDLAFRLYGNPVRIAFNILQSIQLICSVGIICISNGEAFSEVTKFKLCYAVCVLIWALVGMALGQVRTLQKFGFIANAAVWINITIMALTMGAAAHTKPLFSAYQSAAGYAIDPTLVSPTDAAMTQFPPVQTSGGLPTNGNFVASVNGLMQAVYAYGGAMVFIEFMSEMKQPRDWLKAMWSAQLFIYVCYMFYGLFMYGYQGQYIQNPSYLGIAGYGYQTAGNLLAIFSAVIAAGLYGNIGLKVIYNNIFVELFHSPPLTQKTGKIMWATLIPIYWSLAYIIGAGIPAFSGFVSVVSAACILPFTYVVPPFLAVAFHARKNAMESGDGFDPNTGEVVRRNPGVGRYVKGFLRGRQGVLNVFLVIYCLAATVTCGLGWYSACEGLIAAFKTKTVNAFECRSPLDSTGG